ncbi:hypothetical protein PG993_004008 [Apiospora rasikravindrae]|uniref:Rhodopsin domain-containing protein n=1 Tax=Apiospora rasikravindrae TaxID=990691 RepID=A0ABR1TDY2_9PEZI
MLAVRQNPLDQYQDVDLCAIPLGLSPDGLPPNFENPPSLQPATIAISVVMIMLAVTITAGRFYVNRRSLKPADYFMMVGLVLDLGIAGVLLAASKNFRHAWNTPICWLDTTYLKLTFVEVLVVGPALFFPKAAIFLFYLQLFSINRHVRIGSKVGIGLAFMAYFPASLALCYWDAPHVGQTWEEVLTSGMPQKGVPGGVTVGVASVIVDIYVFILPLPTLLHLQMPFRKRLQLVALFATAMIIVENNVAIIVGSLPAFANFLRIYVSESAFYKSIRSSFSRLSHSCIAIQQPDPPQEPKEQALGAHQQHQRQWHELSDSAPLESQVAVPGKTSAPTPPGNQGITLHEFLDLELPDV